MMSAVLRTRMPPGLQPRYAMSRARRTGRQKRSSPTRSRLEAVRSYASSLQVRRLALCRLSKRRHSSSGGPRTPSDESATLIAPTATYSRPSRSVLSRTRGRPAQGTLLVGGKSCEAGADAGAKTPSGRDRWAGFASPSLVAGAAQRQMQGARSDSLGGSASSGTATRPANFAASFGDGWIIRFGDRGHGSSTVAWIRGAAVVLPGCASAVFEHYFISLVAT